MSKNLKGLSEKEVLISKEEFGSNTLEKEKTKGFFRKFAENLNDPIIKILICALVIEILFTFGKCNFFEVGGIVAAILIATTVSTASEFGSERAFKKMQKNGSDSLVRVLRDGVQKEIPVSELVVGDIVYLFRGELIPADGTIIYGKLSVDQSALNGESRETEKIVSKENGEWDLSMRGKLFRGTLITFGEAIMKVERVGMDTYYGMVARDIQTETRESPLKRRLSHLAGQISKIGYIMAFVVALAYLFNAIVVENRFVGEDILSSIKDYKSLFSILLHALTLMITVVVVAVPEGLPMMITVVLSANMKKMLGDGVLVKKLVGIETAGSMNLLFTDKTGTITTGEPKCEKIASIDSEYKSISALKKNGKLYSMLVLCGIYNTDAYESGGKIFGGNGTDRAIYDYFKNEQRKNYKVIEKQAFSSEKKFSSIVLDDGKTFIKGAPEIIISKSTLAVDSDGNTVALDKTKIRKAYFDAATSGNRVIAMAYTEGEGEEVIFLALLVLKDMLRRDTKDSIREIQRAGVRIVMLTGDGKETASAIASECGIIRNSSRDIVLTSDELNSLTDDEAKKILPSLCVLARALPQDKTRLVRLAQEMGLVVGMTGDGINDAPSLKLADIGFAMGSGADIAKDAGDIVILNDSLFSINRTILYGRTIFKSIRKFITFQLVMNLAACGISLFGQLIGIENPITIIQMLWINIIMDTLGGLAFAGEPALEYYMKEKPKERDEPILNRDMLLRIIAVGVYSLGLCIVFLTAERFRNLFTGNNSNLRFLTAFYALFVFLGIFNCFCARCERMRILSNISKNKPFIFIMLLIAVIQIIMIYYGGGLFRTCPLTAREFVMIIGLAFTVIPFDMLRRIFMKLK